ncbi:sigma-S stabilization anti-adapter protein IraP [Atlantibacter subterraneus]|uniref:sigma-S stabilization anti-adapter protein IraP n=1 Tax=Atlantibacter subterraneus TaxID=255519 RepID=UPI003A5BEEE2
MRAILAELVDNIAAQDTARKAFIIRTDALHIVVAALVARLDEPTRLQLRDEINQALTRQQNDNPSFNDENRLLLIAVEELPGSRICLLPEGKKTLAQAAPRYLLPAITARSARNGAIPAPGGLCAFRPVPAQR